MTKVQAFSAAKIGEVFDAIVKEDNGDKVQTPYDLAFTALARRYIIAMNELEPMPSVIHCDCGNNCGGKLEGDDVIHRGVLFAHEMVKRYTHGGAAQALKGQPEDSIEEMIKKDSEAQLDADDPQCHPSVISIGIEAAKMGYKDASEHPEEWSHGEELTFAEFHSDMMEGLAKSRSDAMMEGLAKALEGVKDMVGARLSEKSGMSREELDALSDKVREGGMTLMDAMRAIDDAEKKNNLH